MGDKDGGKEGRAGRLQGQCHRRQSKQEHKEASFPWHFDLDRVKEAAGICLACNRDNTKPCLLLGWDLQGEAGVLKFLQCNKAACRGPAWSSDKLLLAVGQDQRNSSGSGIDPHSSLQDSQDKCSSDKCMETIIVRGQRLTCYLWEHIDEKPCPLAASVSGRREKGLTNDLKRFSDFGQHIETVAPEYFNSDNKWSRALFGSHRSSHLSTVLRS